MGEMPQPEVQDTTHTYVARAWYRDASTLVGIVGIAALVIQDHDFQDLVPERFHTLLAKLTVALMLILRYTSATRPVAMQEGQTREVRSIAPRT